MKLYLIKCTILRKNKFIFQLLNRIKNLKIFFSDTEFNCFTKTSLEDFKIDINSLKTVFDLG